MTEPASASFPALGTTATIAVCEPEALAPARAALEDELAAVDRACSRFRPDSELVRLNESAGGAVAVGGYLFAALERAVEAAQATDGAVDPTVGPALRANGYDQTFTRVRLRDGRFFLPTSAVAAGWRWIELDRDRRTVTLAAGVELDLGATAKALAADRAAAAAFAVVGTGVLVALGGDVAVSGEPPAGGWPVGVADDHAADPDQTMPTVSISTGGLATSSTTVRRWRTAVGERHHIVDPRTGASAETPWRTVTVAAASCFDANTASTAALVLGRRAPAWLVERRLPARLVAKDGSVVALAGWPEEDA